MRRTVECPFVGTAADVQSGSRGVRNQHPLDVAKLLTAKKSLGTRAAALWHTASVQIPFGTATSSRAAGSRRVRTPQTATLLGLAPPSLFIAAAAVRRRHRRSHWSKLLRDGEHCQLATKQREDLDRELAESLQERTLEALDFGFVVERLRNHCYTAKALGLTENLVNLLAPCADEARRLYQEVDELTRLEDSDLQLADPMNIEAHVDQALRGAILDAPELRDVAEAIRALVKLRNGVDGAAARGLPIPSLVAVVQHIQLPDELLDLMLDAFEEDAELSEAKFPQIAETRRRIREVEDMCAAEIKHVLASGKYRMYLADDGYMQIGGRYVLSVKPMHRHKVGQVLDESRSGRTVYVEPTELVGMSTELMQWQQELKFAVRRILGQMSVAISRASDALKACLEAAARIDLARARLFLGEDMEGEIPEVGDSGIISLRNARNPCLLLRGAKVVGYRLDLGTWSQGLILSGPNAGGKTVVLKTIGLMALLARCGIPIPAGDAPRVDFFEVVLAEVGDMQTIVDDLSTYSARLVASRIMLSRTTNTGTRALVMIDESGTGTDPAQGAALARAIIEALLDRGARVVATTHCIQLKNWAMEDPRTEIAAMEYREGRPTFRLVRNAIGESHAIQTARQLKLPDELLARAEELLNEDQRGLLALQRRVEELESQLKLKVQQAVEREQLARVAEKRAEARATLVAAKEQSLAAAEQELMARQERLRSQLDADFQARAAVHEKKLRDIIEELKSSVKEGGSHLNLVGSAIEDLRLERDEEAERHASQKRTRQVHGAMAPEDPLNIGDWVVVLARTPWYGFKGCVERITSGSFGRPSRVSIKLEGTGNALEMDKTELGKATAPQSEAQRQNSKPPVRDFNRLVKSW